MILAKFPCHQKIEYIIDEEAEMKEYTNKEKDKDASKANHIGQNTSKGKSNGEKKTNTEVGDKMLKNMLKSK